MSTPSPFPQVQVSVVIVERAQLYLAEYNPKWQTFALPVARLRRLRVGDTASRESSRDAAVRAATKALGRPLLLDNFPKRVERDMPARLICRSGRDDNTKSYTYHVFALHSNDPAPRHALGWHTIWMKRDDFLTHSPVSPTACFVWEHLAEHDLP